MPRWLIFLLAATVASVFFIDFCNLMYACGCRSLWAGADTHCNIHHATGRRCPWCAIGLVGGVAVWGAIVGSQAAVVWAWRGEGAITRLVLALAAFPVTGGALALALGWARGYWA